MRSGIAADGRYLRISAREVNTQMSVKVIVRDMLDGVRCVMGGTDIDRAVGKYNPHCLGSPCGLTAEGFLHACGIIGRQRFCVCMGADGEDMNLPGNTGAEIVYGAFRDDKACAELS